MSVQNKLTKEIITKAEDLKINSYFKEGTQILKVSRIEYNVKYDLIEVYVFYMNSFFAYAPEHKINAWRYVDYEKEQNQLEIDFNRKYINRYGLPSEA